MAARAKKSRRKSGRKAASKKSKLKGRAGRVASAKRSRRTARSAKRGAAPKKASAKRPALKKKSAKRPAIKKRAATRSAGGGQQASTPSPISRVTRVAKEVAQQASTAVTEGLETVKEFGGSIVDRVTDRVTS
jgi:hypothetical protein